MRINVLVLDDVFDLGLSAVLDAFQTANEIIQMSKLEIPRFQVNRVGVRRKIRTAHGFTLPLDPVGARTPDYVVVPAIAFKMPAALETALGRKDVGDAASALQKWARGGAM